jgi:hypothetical protein
MNSSISIAHHYDGSITITRIIDDEKTVHERLPKTRKKWDMSEIFLPLKRFKLDIKENVAFTKALYSSEGRKILQRMKNEATNKIINQFLTGYSKRLPDGKLLKSFTEEIIKEPLVGVNMLSNISIGVTKKQIFDEFVKSGLIKI